MLPFQALPHCYIRTVCTTSDGTFGVIVISAVATDVDDIEPTLSVVEHARVAAMD